MLLRQPTHLELIEIAKEMGLILSFKQANQALFFAREYTDDFNKYETSSLIHWF
jgi:hypothetical protein